MRKVVARMKKLKKLLDKRDMEARKIETLPEKAKRRPKSYAISVSAPSELQALGISKINLSFFFAEDLTT